MMRLLLLFVFATCSSLAWIADDQDHVRNMDHHCGVEHVHKLEAALDQAKMKRLIDSSQFHRHLQKLTCTELCTECITIDVVFQYV